MFQTMRFFLFCQGKPLMGFHRWSLFKKGHTEWTDEYRCSKCKRKQHTW